MPWWVPILTGVAGVIGGFWCAFHLMLTWLDVMLGRRFVSRGGGVDWSRFRLTAWRGRGGLGFAWGRIRLTVWWDKPES